MDTNGYSLTRSSGLTYMSASSMTALPGQVHDPANCMVMACYRFFLTLKSSLSARFENKNLNYSPKCTLFSPECTLFSPECTLFSPKCIFLCPNAHIFCLNARFSRPSARFFNFLLKNTLVHVNIISSVFYNKKIK